MTKMKKTVRQKWAERMLLFIFCGVGGFIYETLLFRIEQHIWVKRGVTYGPWITIYAIGGVLILETVARKWKKPWSLFAAASVVSGAVEYIGALILDQCFGIRLWDYSIESPSWRFMNINGYISLRSVATFGLLIVIFQYLVRPSVEKLLDKCGEEKTFHLALLLMGLYVLDLAASLCRAVL